MVVIGDTPWDAQGMNIPLIKINHTHCCISAALAAKLRIAGVLCGGFDERLLRQAGCDWIYRDIIDLTKNYDQLTKDLLKD